MDTQPEIESTRTARIARTLFGGGLDRRLVPIVAISLTYSASFSTFWVYVGIYAVKGLHWLALIAAVIVVFVLGEMVWMPTSQTIAAELAPEASRGTYFGALAAMTGPAWTLTPFVAFQLRDHLSVGSVWLLLAAVALAAAATGAAAAAPSR